MILTQPHFSHSNYHMVVFICGYYHYHIINMKMGPYNWSNLFLAKTSALLGQNVLGWTNPKEDSICYVILGSLS